MAIRRTLLLVIALFLCLPPLLFPQVAKRELLPEGQLNLSPGNISVISADHPTRIYGALGYYGGSEVYADQTNYDVSGDAFQVAADLLKKNTYISIGYTTISYNRETVFEGSNVTADQDTTSIGGRVSFMVGQASALGLQASMESEKRSVAASNGFSSSSASADLQFVDILVGGTTKVSKSLSLGLEVSPAVSDKSNFNGALSGNETKGGHGFQAAAGIGYLASDFAGGVDVGLESENIDSNSEAVKRAQLSAEMLFVDLSVSGSLELLQSEELAYSGDFLLPSYTGTVWRLRAKKEIDNLELALSYTVQQLTASDFGDAAADSDRFDTSNVTLVALILSGDF